ncbi:mucin TcMUC [Trypanosoma cruzi]|uniref:Mucin TcMUC n=1 Tax=Trypanosoma cruzi TaxID=5693 RepID=A0A7J6XNQ5_TRYCR|nr:mucin TcMUC [Trypanosoma cruzi]
MRAHARRAQPGVIIVCEGLPCGCHNGSTVFLTGASRAGRHRSCQACRKARHAGSTNAGTRDGPGSSATASSETPLAADPPTDHGRLCLIHCGNALVVGNMDCDCVGLPSPHDGQYETEYLPLLYGRPLPYSLVIVAAYNQNKITSCFVMNIGCTSRGPTIRVVCGDLLFIVTLLLCCCVRCTFLCVCVLSVRGADTTDLSRLMYMRWCLVCRSCLLLPLPSVCWCCGRAVCVCLLPWIGVCVVRGVRRTVHAWLLPSPHVVCPLCVSAASLVSPVALHIPHCADKLHTTERPHSR